MKHSLKFGVVLGLFLAVPQIASAQELNLVCSAEQDWCDFMVNLFEEETGADVAMVRKSSGEALA